ncbi:MAG: BamA/OMP85 family outer membrane protein [bacterium]
MSKFVYKDKYIVISLLCIFLFACYLFGQEEIEEQLKVIKIKIDGNKSIKKKEILEVMQIKKGDSYKSYILDYLIDSDETVIREFYEDKGFFKADADINIKYEGKDRVEVCIKIDEGKPCRIKSIDIVGDLTDEEKKKLWRSTDITPGQTYSESDINSAERGMFSYLAERSYIYSDISIDVLLNEDNTECDVIFNINKGEMAYFGGCVIEGLKSVDENIVRREFAFKEGQPYKPSLISETKSRIYKTGLFTDLDFKPLNYEMKPVNVDLLLILREENQQYIELYPGYESPDEAKFGVGWGHNNFLGNNRRLTISGNVSYGFKSKEDEEDANISLYEPYLFNLRLIGKVSLYVKRVGKSTYDYEKLGSVFEIEKELSQKIKFFETYNIAKVWVSENVNNLPHFIEEGPRYTTSLKSTLRYDSRDNPFNPLNGAYSYGSIEMAGWFLPGTDNFVRAIIELNRYMPVSEGGLIVLHYRIGDIEPVAGSDTIPIYERFFAGGAYSVRGFEQDKLGPLNSEGEPIGGRFIMAMGVDFRFRLPFLGNVKIPGIGLPLKNLWGAIFIDGGNVFERREDFKTNRLRFGGGFGFRYNTPFGPIRFDIATPLDENEIKLIYHIALGHAY